MWGVGCIFVEMITGMPTFPGIRDTYDQLDKIFKLLGTPTEDSWRGVTHLPGYKPQKLGKFIRIRSKLSTIHPSIHIQKMFQSFNYRLPFSYCTGFYRPRKLGHSFPRLYDIVEGEAIASLFLQLNPEERIGAEDALNHSYFAPLPRKLFELPDGKISRFCSIIFCCCCPSIQSFNGNVLIDQFRFLSFSITETSIFTVEGVFVYPEPNRQNKWKLAHGMSLDGVRYYCWNVKDGDINIDIFFFLFFFFVQPRSMFDIVCKDNC